jgi:hypothetical protein
MAKATVNLANLSCRDYADYMKLVHPDWGSFQPRGTSMSLYLHAGSRLVLTHEQHTEPGFGHDRLEAQAATGKPVDDDDEFVSDFVNMVGEFMSLHQLKKLIPALEAMRDEEEASRQRYLSAT